MLLKDFLAGFPEPGEYDNLELRIVELAGKSAVAFNVNGETLGIVACELEAGR